MPPRNSLSKQPKLPGFEDPSPSPETTKPHHALNPPRPEKTQAKVIAWDAVLDALDNRDVTTLLQFADQLGICKPIQQEGVSVEEQITQIKRLAPGKHPHTSALIRGLCESLKQASGEGLR